MDTSIPGCSASRAGEADKRFQSNGSERCLRRFGHHTRDIDDPAAVVKEYRAVDSGRKAVELREMAAGGCDEENGHNSGRIQCMGLSP